MNCVLQLQEHKWTLIFFDLLLTPKEVKSLELCLKELSSLSYHFIYIINRLWELIYANHIFSSERGRENHQLYSRLAALGFITRSCLPVSITSWYHSCMSLNAAEFTNSSSHNCLIGY